MFSADERDRVREWVLELARRDSRVTAGALTGSTALGAEDQWSDIDLAFAVADGVKLETILDEWASVFADELGALDYFDLRSGSSMYRVFLLPSGLEVDVAVTPERDFGARGPRFRPLFGEAREVVPAPPPDTRILVGYGWHHIFHARSCIERGKRWQAEYWISGIRDQTLALACLRLGLEAVYARGVDRLPAAVAEPLAGALVRSLDETELRRALAVATACFLGELEAWDPALWARLRLPLREFGAPEDQADS